MKTSRRALDRLLDAKNAGLTLDTLQRPAGAVGRQLLWDWVYGKARPCAPMRSVENQPLARLGFPYLYIAHGLFNLTGEL